MANENNKFYVYVHFDTINHLIFYVGKGTKDRANNKSGRNHIWNKYVEFIDNQYKVFIVKSNLSAYEALELEQLIITKYGSIHFGGSLTNSKGFDFDLRLIKDLPKIGVKGDIITSKYAYLSDDLVIADILSFPNLEQCSIYEKSFEVICDSFDNSKEKLSKVDSELCFEIEMVYDDLFDLIQEFKHNSINKLDFDESIILLSQDLANIRIDFEKQINYLFENKILIIENLIKKIINNEDLSSIQYMPFNEAKKYVKKLGLSNSSEWWEWLKLDEKPFDIPSRPDRSVNPTYQLGWKGYKDWLGTEEE